MQWALKPQAKADLSGVKFGLTTICFAVTFLFPLKVDNSLKKKSISLDMRIPVVGLLFPRNMKDSA